MDVTFDGLNDLAVRKKITPVQIALAWLQALEVHKAT